MKKEMLLVISLMGIAQIFTSDLNQQLFCAVKEEDCEKVKELLLAGANPNYADRWGIKVLIYAVQQGNFDIVAQLIKAGADVNFIDILGGTALIAAAREGYGNIVAQLIAAGADVKAEQIGGNTALMFAVEKGFRDIVTQLIAAGAQWNAKFSREPDWVMKIREQQMLKKLKEITTQWLIGLNPQVVEARLREKGTDLIQYMRNNPGFLKVARTNVVGLVPDYEDSDSMVPTIKKGVPSLQQLAGLKALEQMR